jgi:putative toxin-antitoxin system antitoxin component (TIGR02293 family)
MSAPEIVTQFRGASAGTAALQDFHPLPLCGKIPHLKRELSMSESGTASSARRHGARSRSFTEVRTRHDSRVFALFLNRALQRMVQAQSKTNLQSLWDEIARKLRTSGEGGPAQRAYEPLQIHRQIVEGLPGEALFVSSAMVFNSMADALSLFDVSAKTAKQRLGERLSSGESEIALRIGRALTIAQEVLGSPEVARQYLRSPNFALGGAVPRDLLKTSEGEQLVLSELQTQAEGGPV